MRNKIILLIAFISFSITFTAFAQHTIIDTNKVRPHIKKFYLGTALDGGIFSSATIQENEAGATTNKLGILRFSYILNTGLTFNFNFGRHLGAYTGIDVKNIGFIEKDASAETVKRRTYNIGIPVGIKIGNMAAKKSYFFFGGGADAPFNYREKRFIVRDQKTTKFSEWFSNRTPAIMPYVFAGFKMSPGIAIKVQYYPTNFFNTDYVTNGAEPYADYSVHLILVTLGLAIPITRHQDIVKKQVSELHLM